MSCQSIRTQNADRMDSLQSKNDAFSAFNKLEPIDKD